MIISVWEMVVLMLNKPLFSDSSNFEIVNLFNHSGRSLSFEIKVKISSTDFISFFLSFGFFCLFFPLSIDSVLSSCNFTLSLPFNRVQFLSNICIRPEFSKIFSFVSILKHQLENTIFASIGSFEYSIGSVIQLFRLSLFSLCNDSDPATDREEIDTDEFRLMLFDIPPSKT